MEQRRLQVAKSGATLALTAKARPMTKPLLVLLINGEIESNMLHMRILYYRHIYHHLPLNLFISKLILLIIIS